MNKWLLIGILALASFGSGFQAEKSTSPPNVLFIMVDDLRPQIGCYGYEDMKTPNMGLFTQTGEILGSKELNCWNTTF
ncbi:MAG: hypothetical protein RIG62_30735 [Cyclobacteriaceae bacterium]